MPGNVITTIPALFGRCSPSAIVGTIWTVIVYAIQGMIATWLAPHIFKEGWKRIPPTPSFADGNPPSSPFWISLVFGIKAARSHAGPCSVFRRGFISSVVSVFEMRFTAPEPADMIWIRLAFVNSSGHTA